jgi:hypothetical protein
MPKIEVSQQTMRRIEEASTFRDADAEDVIIRALNQMARSSQISKSGGGEELSWNGSPADLVTQGGRVPHGSKLRATYKGKEYRARVEDGVVVWNGQTFSSLSEAAVAVVQSKTPSRTTENGWRFWQIKTPNGQWRPGLELRDKG